MAILVNRESRVICQGITGRNGTFHSIACRDYGTNMVGGVTPGKKGTFVDGIPVFNTVEEAVLETGANVSLIFIPAAYAKDPILEAVDAGHKGYSLYYRRDTATRHRFSPLHRETKG